MKELESVETKNIIAVRGSGLTLLGDVVKEGTIARDFVTIDNNSKEIKLSDFKGKVVVLSVFPSVDTAVCAAQTRTFNKKASELSNDVIILTISKDLPFALGRFCAAEGINNITTTSDYKYSEFGLKYGFLIKENMLLARGVVIIDKDGVVKYVEYVPDIIHEPQYEKSIEVIKGLI